MKTTLIALTVLLFGAGGCVKLKAASAGNRQAVHSMEDQIDQRGIKDRAASFTKYHHPANQFKK